MLLAGDVGGTKTLLGLFERGGPRPLPVATRSYETATFHSFTAMLDRFAADVGALAVDAAAVGVAGPVVDQSAIVTNIGWAVHGREIAQHLGIPRAHLLNDLEAMGASVEALGAGELATLQAGTPNPAGNAAVMAAGTGLGVATLHRVGGRLVPLPSETGHTDLAARTDAEIALLRSLRGQFGRATLEHVLSGQGFVNIHRLTHASGTCRIVPDLASPMAPALVSQAGLDGACTACREALGMFVDIYGAEAGNLALRTMATAGVYIGGGIAPKILPALQEGRFMRAFLAKEPMEEVVKRIPVHVILNQEAGLLGAAVTAAGLLA